MTSAVRLAEQIAARLGRVEGVVAVALGGSWARGTADHESDLDLGIYYDPLQPPSVERLRDLAAELDDSRRRAAVTDYGDWGPWINGGAWLQIQGRRVDWLYRDLDRVRSLLEATLRGASDCYYQPGHPHGFHTHVYAGEVYYNCPLFDPTGALQRLKGMVEAYPPLLKKRLIKGYLWEAQFAIETSRKAAARGDVFYVSGTLFRCAACLVQVVFALNERYFVNEKGSMRVIEEFHHRPPDFTRVVADVLARPGESAPQLQASVGRCEQLVREMEQLAARS